ncbi:hypothetical protein LINPERHAP1_LOCUS6802, partial [Linum perenne]
MKINVDGGNLLSSRRCCWLSCSRLKKELFCLQYVFLIQVFVTPPLRNSWSSEIFGKFA